MKPRKSLIERAKALGIDTDLSGLSRAERRRKLKARLKKKSHTRGVMTKSEGKRKSITESL